MLADQTRMDVVERRLVAWGAWLAQGRCGDGYPVMSIIHPDWTPPAKGAVPGMAVASARGDADERRTADQVQALSVRLRDALFVTYCKRLPLTQRALLLECRPETVLSRVAEAKRQLAAMGPGF